MLFKMNSTAQRLYQESNFLGLHWWVLVRIGCYFVSFRGSPVMLHKSIHEITRSKNNKKLSVNRVLAQSGVGGTAPNPVLLTPCPLR